MNYFRLLYLMDHEEFSRRQAYKTMAREDFQYVIKPKAKKVGKAETTGEPERQHVLILTIQVWQAQSGVRLRTAL